VIVLEEFLKKIGKSSSEIRVAIQGFGNAGKNVAEILEKKGFQIVAVSDSSGGVFEKEGLKISEVVKRKEETGKVGEGISNSELLELDVDVLILAALENQITSENADKIQAEYILELANGPISADADEILFKKEIAVLPDILANAGGVVVSYFEWCQNRTGNILDEDYLKEKLGKIMRGSFEKVYDFASRGVSLREAAYVIAIKRILAAERARGNIGSE